MADEVVPVYLREILLNAGPFNPETCTLVAVDGTGQDMRVPFRLFDTGRDRTQQIVISAGIAAVPVQHYDYFNLDLTEDITGWSFGTMPYEDRSATIAIRINQGATPYLLEWPDNFWWTGDAPLISMEANRSDLLVLTTMNSGVTWLADLARGYRAPTP